MHRVALDYDAATAQQANSPRKANQIIMLQKLLIFSCNRKPTDPIDDRLSGLQTEMLLRLMMGAVFEVWLLIEKRFAGRPIGRDYQVPLIVANEHRARLEVAPRRDGVPGKAVQQAQALPVKAAE